MDTTESQTQTTPADDARAGHYRIRRLLGEGGFGQVFEAWDEQLCRPVALKRLRAGDAAPTALLDEARRAAALRHPAFVRIFAVTGQGANQSIVMELVQGRTLRQCLAAGVPTSAAALDIAAEIADAMAEAHDIGLVHGDIKPANLMLDAGGKVRILDFGLAHRADPLATGSGPPTDAQGTFAYMAPERLLGHPLSAACDVYALGVLLYEMLAGQRPFAELDGLALAAAHVQTPPQAWPLPAHLDPGLVRLVRALTARDPAQRIASMRAAADTMLALRAAPGAGAPAPPVPAQAADTAYRAARDFSSAVMHDTQALCRRLRQEDRRRLDEAKSGGPWEISLELTVRIQRGRQRRRPGWRPFTNFTKERA